MRIKNGGYPGDKLTEEQSSARLYHYTSFDTFVKIWLGQKLKFSDITLMNDICEARKQFSTQVTYGFMERFDLTQQLIKPYKQISFTKDYDSYTQGCMSPYMWGHYGVKNNGVCIEFAKDRISFKEHMVSKSVVYKDNLKIKHQIPYNKNTEEEIRGFLDENIEQIFFTKSKDWQGENEFRVISDKDDWLNIENSIKAVYVTNPNSQECILLETLLPESIPVKFYGFTSEKDCYKPYVQHAKKYRDDLAYATKLQEEANKKALERRNSK